MFDAASSRVMLVAPIASTILVDEIPIQGLDVLDGLGVSNHRIGLVSASQLPSVTILVNGTAQLVGHTEVGAYGGGAVVGLSALGDGDEVRFGSGLQKVFLNSAAGSRPVIVIAGDNTIGNGSATVTPLVFGSYSITLSYGSTAELIIGSSSANLVAADMELQSMNVLGQTQEVFQQSSMPFLGASAMTIAISANTSLTADYAILLSTGVHTGTLINELRFKAFLPELAR